ncbi:MAG: exosome complex protein Rrp42 [Candidatus Methanoperedens sp.]|nr:exosome complex protein Rrp42 [Candidatus Methanoperedens sp.]MCZ7370188.1 exosome complex protein Rrp42 [Candidatus Methanoperedens sp.]
MSMSNEIMAELRKDYIYNLMIKGEREDGRAFDQYREITIDTRVIDKAEGSARVKIGDTQLVVGVKIQTGTPFPDTPDQGVIITNLELIPLASPVFEAGPPREDAIELARVVDRGIRESQSIDLSKLCITPGEKVWMVFIDVHVLDDGGNIMDAASLGSVAALLTAKLPNKRFDLGEDTDVPMREVPVSVTAVEIGGAIMLDPSLDEESIAGTKLTVTSNQDGAISAMQKSGVHPLTTEQINYIVDIAIEKAKEIREKFLVI